MEEILGIYPANELWGINRRAPCHIVLSDERIVVVKGVPRRRARQLARTALEDPHGLERILEESHYALPYGKVRWVDLRHFLTHTLLKFGTPGGTYRFRIRKRAAQRMKARLRGLLGDIIREKPVRD